MLALYLCAPGAFAYDYDKTITIDRSKIPNSCGTTTRGGPSSCTLAQQIDKCVNTTGELVPWMKLPSVDASGAGSNLLLWRLRC